MSILRQLQNRQTFAKLHPLLAGFILSSSCVFAVLAATPASATSTSSTAANTPATNIPSRAKLEEAIDRVENFTEYQTYSARGTSGQNLPHYKEYAHLRSLVTEMIYVSTNYDTISISDDSWKIAYLIDYSADALRGCEYLFGLKKTQSASSQSSTSSTTSSTTTPAPIQPTNSASASNTSDINRTAASSHPLASSPESTSEPANNPTSQKVNDDNTTYSNEQNSQDSPSLSYTNSVNTLQSTSTLALADPLTLPSPVRPLVRQLIQLCTNMPTHPDQLDLPRRRAFLVESV